MAILATTSGSIKIWSTNNVPLAPEPVDPTGPSTGWLTKRIVFKAWTTNTAGQSVRIYDQSLAGSYLLGPGDALECNADNTNLLRIDASQANQGLSVYMERQENAT